MSVLGLCLREKPFCCFICESLVNLGAKVDVPVFIGNKE